MKIQNNTIGRAKICCALCGEKLTAPVFFQGKIYGWSCIKKVNPAAKKVKTNYVIADSFTIKEFPKTESQWAYTAIEAKYQGTNHKPVTFSGGISFKTYADGRPFIDVNGIQLVEGVAYIDLLKYKKGIF
jgi:hypothetical protein